MNVSDMKYFGGTIEFHGKSTWKAAAEAGGKVVEVELKAPKSTSLKMLAQWIAEAVPTADSYDFKVYRGNPDNGGNVRIGKIGIENHKIDYAERS